LVITEDGSRLEKRLIQSSREVAGVIPIQHAIAGRSLVKRLYVESSQEPVNVLGRLAKFSVVRVCLHVATRFGIKQNGLDNGLQVSARACTTGDWMKPGAVVVKDGCDSLHVGAARIARHQMLDQLFAEEWADIRVVKDVI